MTCHWMIGMPGVCALLTVWPDVSMLGADNLRKLVGQNFHHLGKKYDVFSMWGNIHLQWRLLIFFWLDAAWLNEGRCPGGRPSVS